MEYSEIAGHVIGEEQVREANIILHKYKDGKANLESRIIENEQWWKLRHTETNFGSETDMKQSSAWLFNCIISKHADGMESYPTFNCLPREESDKEEAEKLSDILPVVLKQNKFEQVYSDELWQKLKSGTGIYGVFWDGKKLNGLGDISIKVVEPLNLFWQPGIKNIQDSRNVFYVKLVDNDILVQQYPELENKITADAHTVNKYIYDDNVDTSEKTAVIDWYYKKIVNGREVLHYVKYVNNVVLYASENDEKRKETGWYAHAQYPFVFDVLFPVEGSPCGFGYIDVCRQPQKYIDILNQVFTKNAIMASSPRFFTREDGSVNEEEFADYTKTFVHTHGNLGEDSIRQIQVAPLNSIYLSYMQEKINELKETSGNRDVNNGGAASGVTAASAIAAMQEQSGKTSRDSTKTAYRSYEEIVNLCIELVREFYDVPRQYRITGDMGIERFVTYSNEGIKPQPQGNEYGMDMGYRLPVFDLEINAQRESSYSKMAQNELALQFYNAGFFNPELADQAMATLDMMDFKGKNEVMQKIADNQMLFKENAELKQQLLQLAQIVDKTQGTNMSEQIAGTILGESAAGFVPNARIQMPERNIDSEGIAGKNTIVENARERAQESTQVE